MDDYKQQVRLLQQKIESVQITSDREKKERERVLNEERGKTETYRVQLESKKEELVKVIINKQNIISE